MCDGGSEYIGNRGIYGTRLTNVERSHHPSNPIFIGKIWMLKDNDDDDDFEVIEDGLIHEKIQ